MWLAKEHKFANKKLRIWERNCFGKNICHLKLITNMRKWDNLVIIIVTDWMAIDFNMLGTLMKNRICNNLNGTCIVSIKRCWLYLWKSKFSQKTTKANYFLTSCKHRTILRFNKGFRDPWLLLTFPWDQRRAKKHAPTCDICRISGHSVQSASL
jgi:hypothetical protein